MWFSIRNIGKAIRLHDVDYKFAVELFIGVSSWLLARYLRVRTYIHAYARTYVAINTYI